MEDVVKKAEEELLEFLEKKLLTEADGMCLADCVAVLYNRYGDYGRQSGELMAMVSGAGRERILLLFYASGLALAHDWVKKGFSDWDERIMASESFAYKNKKMFQDGFLKMAGFVPKCECRGRYGFAQCLDPDDLRRLQERKCAYLLGFWPKWDQIHPTVKQAFFGGMVRACMDLSDKGILPPLSYSSVCFPFL